MKIKQLVILILIAAGLIAAVWYLKKDSKETGGDSSTSAGGKVVAFPIEKVAQLTLRSAEGTVNLAHKGDAWTVQERADFPANFERVENLLKKLWDLKVVQEIKAGPSQHARFDLTDPAQDAGKATRVDFKDKDGKPLAALLVGKQFMKKSDAAPSPFGDAGGGGFPAGRYVMTPGSANVSLISETLDDVDAKPVSWLRHDFFKIENPSSVTLAGTTDAQKWKVSRTTSSSEWNLDGAAATEKVDQAKVSPVANAFANPAFADVMLPDAKSADTGLDKPATVTITTFDGFTYVLKIGKETAGNLPVTVAVTGQFAKERTPAKDEKPEEKTKLDDEFKAKIKKFEEKLAAEKKFEGQPFLIAKYTLDSILKDRAALLEEKKPEPAPGTTPQPTGGAPLVPGFPPPMPGAPGANVPPTPRAPVTITTPPIGIPPVPAEPPKAPKKPELTTATTPPVTVPTPSEPAKPPVKPGSPDKPEAPVAPQTPPLPAPPAPQPAPPPGK